MQNRETQIDELCRRRCAFALYRLPHGQPRFCMAADGRTEAAGTGFLLCTFEGERCVIPAECTEPPAAHTFVPLPSDAPTAPATTRGEYARLFRRCQATLAAGELQKIVLARTADVPRPRTFSPYAAFLAAAAQRADTFTALIHTPQFGTWLINTPELLLQTEGTEGRTMALAGTRPCSAAPWDAKNQAEQALVAEHVRNVLTRHAAHVQESPVTTLPCGAIEHLCTQFRFTLATAEATTPAEYLAPTPAVSGAPVEAAKRFLQQHPDVERSLYAGYAGPQNADGCALFVSLRCMRIYASVCRLYAGGGIMPGSEEEAEWQETESKTAAMRAVLNA